MILLVTIIALILRLILANQSLWLDEAASVEIASTSLIHFLAKIQTDFHPPLFYLLLKAWLPLAGTSEWLLRLPNIIFGTLSIPAIYFLIKNKKIALLAALLLAINPLHIYYSQELRMYSLNGLLTVLSWAFLLKPSKNKNRAIYILTSILNIYTFYGAFFNLVAQVVYVFINQRKELKNFAVNQAIIIISFLPFLSIFLHQLQGGGYLTSSLPGWDQISGSLTLKSLALIPVKFSLGRINFQNKFLYGMISLIFTSYLFLLVFLGAHFKGSSRRIRGIKFFIFWIITPLLLASFGSLISPMLGYWRYIYIVPAFTSLIATGLYLLPKKLFLINTAITIASFLFFSIVFFSNPIFHREDWRQASEIISIPNSLVILNFSDIFAPLKFYASDLDYYLTQKKLGTVRSDLDDTLPETIGGKDSVFVLDYLSGLTDPKRSVVTWLSNAGFIQKQVYNVNGVGLIYKFEPPDENSY
jgi:uncharacterized membrane protein